MKTDILLWISLAIVLNNLYIMGTSRLSAMIRAVAIQGVLLSILPLLLSQDAGVVHRVILTVTSAAVKGFLIPYFLFKAVRDVRVARDVDSAIGYSLSVTFGVIISAASFYILKQLPISTAVVHSFYGSIAVVLAFTGILVVVSRRNVIAQIVGYLIFENSAFSLGVSLASSHPLFVEMGVLLDVLVGVFIMVVVANKIFSEHGSISIKALEKLVR